MKISPVSIFIDMCLRRSITSRVVPLPCIYLRPIGVAQPVAKRFTGRVKQSTVPLDRPHTDIYTWCASEEGGGGGGRTWH